VVLRYVALCHDAALLGASFVQRPNEVKTLFIGDFQVLLSIASSLFSPSEHYILMIMVAL
jgi:hypothetical protein